jgi:hypothetical protein
VIPGLSPALGRLLGRGWRPAGQERHRLGPGQAPRARQPVMKPGKSVPRLHLWARCRSWLPSAPGRAWPAAPSGAPAPSRPGCGTSTSRPDDRRTGPASHCRHPRPGTGAGRRYTRRAESTLRTATRSSSIKANLWSKFTGKKPEGTKPRSAIAASESAIAGIPS